MRNPALICLVAVVAASIPDSTHADVFDVLGGQVCSGGSCCGGQSCCESDSGCAEPLAFAQCCDSGCGNGLLDNLELFAGLEGSKQPQDFGVNAHFGGRLHANWGVPLVPQWGLGAQLGSAVNLTDHAVRVTSQIDGASDRIQSFTTAGLFQRVPGVLNWAVAYDYLYERDYDRINLTQLRGRIGFQLTNWDEVGVFGMAPLQDDRALWAGIPVQLDPISMGSLYWRRTFDYQAEVTGWLGMAEGHGRDNVALGDPGPVNERIMFGADLHVPLNDHIALFGEANFIMPADTGTVDAYLGFAVYPGGGARGARKRNFSPVLPVANNTSFAVDLAR